MAKDAREGQDATKGVHLRSRHMNVNSLANGKKLRQPLLGSLTSNSIDAVNLGSPAIQQP